MIHFRSTFLNSARQFCRRKRNVYLHNTLHTLSNIDSITIHRLHNGNGIQIFSSTDYFNKLDKLILDIIIFCEISVHDKKVHRIISKEDSIVKFKRKNLKHYSSAKVFSCISPSVGVHREYLEYMTD